MFDNLIESGGKGDLRSIVANNAVSVVFHAIMIALAVYGTLHAGEAVVERVRQVDLTVQTQKQEEKKEEPPPPERVATVDPPQIGRASCRERV